MKRGFLILFVLVSPSFLWPSLTVEEVLGNMESQTKNLENIKFQFHQEIHFLNDLPPTEIFGEALFQKPGKMRVVKKAPEEQLTISNGKKIWVYTPAYKQVWEGTPEKWLKSPLLPKGLVPMDNFVGDLRREYLLGFSSQKSDGGPGVWLMATPKEKDSGYTLELCISTESWLPIKTIFNSESAKIVTDLTNTEINQFLSANMFQFLPPKGTEVIPLN